MEALFECLGKEFGDVGFTSMNINPSHTVNYTKNGKLENIITLTITVYNSYHQNVGKKIIRFINDKYKNTHTQCVFHIIRLRLIIFHTPKILQWRFSL